MAATNKRSRLFGAVVVVALIGFLAIATYASNASFSPHDDASMLEGTSSSATTAPAATPGPTNSTDDTFLEPSEGAPPVTTIPPGAFVATVTYVHDGDTLFLNDRGTEFKVRLIGLDTPELTSQQRRDAAECYGEQARELLRDFLPEGTTVWALEDREPQDRYGRSLLYVYLPDGTFVNLAMVELGAAEALKVGLNDRYWPQLRDAEDSAYAAKLGMWGVC